MKIDPYVLEDIKRMDLPKLIQSYGIVLKPTGKNAYQGHCPFHDDKTPSLSVGYKNNKWMWNCFGCQSHGNYLDFRIMKEKIPFLDAYQKSVEELKTAPAAVTVHESVPAAGSTAIPRQEFLARAVEIYHAAFLEDRRGVDYMAFRGIKDGELFKRHKVGFVNGRLRRMLPEDPGHEFVRGLKEVGILNERGTERFFNCVVFPIYDGNGAVVGLYGRNTRQGTDGPGHLYLPGPHRGVWNWTAIKAHDEVILVESIIDAMSAEALGFPNAVPIYGTNGLTDEHLRLLQEHRTKRVWVCLDNDEAGEKSRRGIMEKLDAAGVEPRALHIPREFKDMNEGLKRGLTGEALRALFTKLNVSPEPPPVSAAPQRTVEPPSIPVQPPTAEVLADTVLTVDRREDGYHFSFGSRVYRVVGLPGKRREHLRVSLKVECGGAVHMDNLDLYSAKSRVTFVTCCRKIFEATEGELHRELNRLIEELEKFQGGEGEKGDEVPPPMTEEDRAEAMTALQSPALYADILRDMETLGYVGEEANKGIGYLVGVSRKLEDPLSCVIISQSSAGKSVLADTVERMTPPEDVVSLSRATPQAFFYIVKDGLVHKLVIMEERVGAENADYAIRTLQSKKKLSQAVSLKDEATGQIKTKFFEVRGPVAYIETTTKPRIHEENATRCFELYLDESAGQTLRIHTLQREGMTLSGLERHGREDRLLRRHHNMQRCLRPIAVVIPYAPLIEFPTAWLRTRRDHPRFFNLIRVVAFLHQHQREVKHTAEGVEYIESNAQDYEIAYGLAKAVMGESFTELKKPQRELLLTVAKLTEGGGDITRRELREAAGIPNRRCWELLEDLVDLEYLEKTQGGRPGQACRYRPAAHVGAVRGDLEGLTTPEALLEKIRARAA